MGACFSKKKGSSSLSFPVAAAKSASAVPAQAPAPAELKNSGDDITISKPKVEEDPEVNVNKEKKILQEKQDPVQEEILIIKHRKSHDGRDRNPKSPLVQQDAAQPVDKLVSATSGSSNEAAELMCNKMAPGAAAVGVGVRTSSCTKEEVDAILIQCGRLSRSTSGKAASSSAASGERGRKYSGSKRSYDFDHCENDTTSVGDDQKRANAFDNSDLCEDEAEKRRHHGQQHRQSPRRSSQGRRRTPSRERDQHQRSSSRERRVSRSPGRRASETTNSTTNASANVSNNSNNGSARPGKMVSVPATISSLTMDKSNSVAGGGESATATGIKRISVKRNVGEASPRSQSPARPNGNAANAKVLNDNQQQPSLSRNSSRKAEKSPYRRNPLSEIDPNSLTYPQTANNSGTREQSRTKRNTEPEVIQKANADINDNARNKATSRVTLDKGVTLNCKTKEHPEEETKVLSSMTENIIKTVVPSGIDDLKPQTLTRSRSARRSRDLDFNPEALLNPGQSYTSLLLEDIQNFHQKNAPSVSLPACVTKACSILEAVADLNSTTSANLSVALSENRKSPPTCQSIRTDQSLSLGANHHGKRMPDIKDPFVESEVAVSDDVMEPSMHKYVTVRRGSLGGVDMEDQESSGSNSFTTSGSQNWGLSSSSWEPNSADSTDCCTSRLTSREEGQKNPLGSGGSLSAEAGRDMNETRKRLNSKRREYDHQHSSGIGRGRLDATKALHAIPVATNGLM